MTKRIVIATNNPHKKRMLKWIVNSHFDVVVDQPKNMHIKEDKSSFKENAETKAIAVSKKCESYSIASDGGVVIPALGNNWDGLLTKRFLGKNNVTDWDRIDGLLKLMKDKKGKDREMIWHEAIALAQNGKLLFSCEVEGDHSFVQQSYNPKQYKSGIWLCTITCYPQFGDKNFFELTAEEQKYAEISWHNLKKRTRTFLKEYFK